jgi:hypothetical protein
VGLVPAVHPECSDSTPDPQAHERLLIDAEESPTPPPEGCLAKVGTMTLSKRGKVRETSRSLHRGGQARDSPAASTHAGEATRR